MDNLRTMRAVAEQGIVLLTSTYPTGRLLPRHRYIVQDVPYTKTMPPESVFELEKAGLLGSPLRT